MPTLNEFLDSPFFTALEVLIISLASELISQFTKHRRAIESGAVTQRNIAMSARTRLWLKNKHRYSRPAFDVRRSWALKCSSEEWKAETVTPASPFWMMLSSVSSIGPWILVSYALSERPALIVPFDIPSILRGLLQAGLPAYLDDPRVVGAMPLYMMLNIAGKAFIGLFPLQDSALDDLPVTDEKMKNKENKKLLRFLARRKQLPPPQKPTYMQLVDTLVSEDHVWELENVEDELLAKIDAAQ
jgi:hypothetical protein